MSFTESVKTCFRNYAYFSGRARRSEYWYWVLFTFAVDLLVIIISGGEDSALYKIVSLALLLPGLAVSIRRMHDIGKSGWAILMALVPVAGIIIYLVWSCRDSQPGSNVYGPNPKEPEVAYSYTPAQESNSSGSYEPVQESEPYVSPFKPAPKADEGHAPAFCPYCGSRLAANAKFCENCGAKVEKV